MGDGSFIGVRFRNVVWWCVVVLVVVGVWCCLLVGLIYSCV